MAEEERISPASEWLGSEL